MWPNAPIRWLNLGETTVDAAYDWAHAEEATQRTFGYLFHCNVTVDTISN